MRSVTARIGDGSAFGRLGGSLGRNLVARGDKSSYTERPKRKSRHIEKLYEACEVHRIRAVGIAWARVTKVDGGGQKQGRRPRGSRSH
jgi:hypothetical protein